MKTKIKWTLIIGWLTLPLCAQADLYAEMGVGAHHLTAITTSSLTANTPYILRFAGVEKGASWLRWQAAFSLISGDAHGTMLSSETEIERSFFLFAGEMQGGCQFTPLGYQPLFAFQPYLGIQMLLDMPMVVTRKGSSPSAPFPKTQTPLYTGYAFSLGAYIFFNDNFGINLQVEQARFVTGGEGSSNHFLDGNRFLITLFKTAKPSQKNNLDSDDEEPRTVQKLKWE